MWITRLVAKRLVLGIITLLVLTAIVFFISQLVPGDPARVAAGADASLEQIEAARVRLGLDQPVFMQYLIYVGHVLTGDLGTSLTTHSSVVSGLAAALPTTLQIVFLSMTMMVVAAVPAATWAALHRADAADGTLRFANVLAAGIPTFWLALMLQYLLSGKLSLLPVSGVISREFDVQRQTGFTLIDAALSGGFGAFWDAFQHLILPAAVLAVFFGAQLFRALRTELINVMAREHITVARAKGVPKAVLIRKHLLPNAIGPVITILGILFGMMVGFSVLVESVFALPGLGSYLTSAIGAADINALLGAVLVVGVVVVLASLAVDILQALRDPRLRTGGAL